LRVIAPGIGPLMEAKRSGRAWYWLLVLPLVGLLVPPIYNHEDPTLIGIPFFYWYQLAWVPISVAVTAFVYRKTKGSAR
jgi:Protein of unknown function (DUF3311)